MKLANNGKSSDVHPKNGLIQVYFSKPILRQLLICGPILVSYFVSGLIIGSPTIIDSTYLWSTNNSTNAISDAFSAWLYSGLGAASLPWIFILPILMNCIGRKLTFMLTWLGIYILYVVSYFTTNDIRMLSQEVILSVSVICGQTVSPTILAEYSSVKYRGMFLSLKSANFLLGMWISRAFGNIFCWKNIGVMSFLFLIYFIAIVCWPESPYWSASKGRLSECTLSHRWLKGKGENSEIELETIVRDSKVNRKSNKLVYGDLKNFFVNIFYKVNSPEFYKPSFINMLLIIQYECSGKFVVNIYALEILNKITGKEFTAYQIMFIFDGLLVLITYIASFSSVYFSRRTLYLNFSAISFLLLFILSFYSHLSSLNLILNNNFVSFSLIVTYSIALYSGPVTFCSSFFAELAPLSHKTLFLIDLGLFLNIFCSIFTQLTLSLFIYLGLKLSLAIFGIFSLVLTIFLYVFLPETKNKTLQAIEHSFANHDYNKDCKQFLDKCLIL